MSKASARNRPARPSKRPNTRRAQEAARRATRRRRRWIGWGTAGTLLAVVVAIVALAVTGGHGNASKAIAVGATAPDGSFTAVSGDTESVTGLRGQPALLWFVATWCSSCQAGTEAMAQKIDEFAAHRVRVVELEMAGDLGQPGPSISAFGHQLAGAAYTNPDWMFGVASAGLTTTYNPASYLDIYYLIDAAGRITYVNGSPASTMGQLLAHVAALRSSA